MTKVSFKWAIEAEKNFTETVDYILDNFGVDVALNFIDKVKGDYIKFFQWKKKKNI